MRARIAIAGLSLLLLSGCEPSPEFKAAMTLLVFTIYTVLATILATLVLGLRIAPKTTLLSFIVTGVAAGVAPKDNAWLFAIIAFAVSWTLLKLIFKKDKWKLFTSRPYVIVSRAILGVGAAFGAGILLFTIATITSLSTLHPELLWFLLFPLPLIAIGLYGAIKKE